MTNTVTIPVTQAAQGHIESLQAALARRNTEIERLTEELSRAEAGEPNQRALADAYKRGWKAATNHLIGATGDAARALGKVRKDAWDIYLKSESRDFRQDDDSTTTKEKNA